MEIIRKDSQVAQKGPEEWFMGDVTLELLYQAKAGTVGIAKPSFQPGARTIWHTHPLGQTLIVTDGKGWTQVEGEEKVEINVGDIVWCPPNTRHWHGATDTTPMTHLAINEALDGKSVEWLEKVSDEEYLA